MKNWGQLVVVKLLPRVVSKGCGSAVSDALDGSAVAAATPFDEVIRVSVACVGMTISDDVFFPRGKRRGSKGVGYGPGTSSSPFCRATSSSDRAQEVKKVKNRRKRACKESARLEVGLLHETIRRVQLR